MAHLPGDDSSFSVYDFRQDDFGDVDWPVVFVFDGHASVGAIADALCNDVEAAWSYCDRGGDMFLYVNDARDAETHFIANPGVKRFPENCSTHSFTAHLRLYGSDGRDAAFTSAKYGNVVFGTAHLDFEDHSGCAARIHGYPDVAEAWLSEAMATIPGWQIRPNAFDLGNGSPDYVVMRDLGGSPTPHVHGNDGSATEVVVPPSN